MKQNWVFDCIGPNQKFGGMCSPACAPGYLPSSPKPTAVCKDDGQWGFGGACDAADCGAPVRPHWSFAACVGGNRKYDGTCRPTCDVGYNWSPSHPTAVCSATGDWQYGGACNAADCGAPRVAGPSEHFNFMACDGPNQKYGGTCRPVCEFGYTWSPSAPTATCQTDGQWAYGGQCLPVYCGPPTHAVVDWTGKCAGQPHGPHHYRDTCAARCPCEYIGLPTAECTGDGRWRYAGNCTPVVCQRCGAGDLASCPDLWEPHQDGDSHVLESFAGEYLGLTFEHAAAAQVGVLAVEAKSSSWRRWVQVWPRAGQAPPREADQYLLFWSGMHKVRFRALRSHGPPARVLSQVVLRQVTCRAPRRRHWKFAAGKCGQWFPGGVCAPECDYLYVGHPTAECRPGREWLFRGFCTLATCLNHMHDEAEETATDCGGECPACPTVIDGRGSFDAALRSYGAVLPAHQRTAQWTATQAYVHENFTVGFLNAEAGTLPRLEVRGVLDPGFFRVKASEAARRVSLVVTHPGAGLERMKLLAFKPGDGPAVVGHQLTKPTDNDLNPLVAVAVTHWAIDGRVMAAEVMELEVTLPFDHDR